MIKEKKAEIIEKFKLHESDTGSPEVQIAILTERDQPSQRTPQRAQKGSSFQKRSAEDGRSEKGSAQLSDEKRHRKVSCSYREAQPQKIIVGGLSRSLF